MLIRELPMSVISGEITYAIHVCGEQRADGAWEGWIEFHPSGLKSILRTDQETSQPNRAAFEYWADGLEPVYLKGALARPPGRLLYEAPANQRKAMPSLRTSFSKKQQRSKTLEWLLGSD